MTKLFILPQITPLTWRRILITILIIGVASVIRLLFFNDLGRGIAYLTYYPAVMIVALYGGLYTGFLGTVISAFLCFYWIQKGFMSPVETLAFIVFLVSCFMISFIAEAMRRARRRATEAQQKAEESNKAKSVFLANMSHELRTPLNAILGYSQLMQRDQEMKSVSKEYLRIINSNGEHLLSLINEILEIAKIEAGRMVLDPVNFNLHAMIEDIAKMFWEETEYKGLQFDILGVEMLPRFVVADGTKLRIVLINLLGNAVKFTHKGKITVRFSTQQHSEVLVLHVEVEDTGPGIAPDEIDKLFNYFIQTDSGRKSQSGTGLGLAISRDYVKMMGGDISVTSLIGEGSTFRFNVSIDPSNEVKVKLAGTVKQVKRLKPGSKIPNVLVTEDMEANRNLLVTLLREVGFEVREAENGKVAVDIFNQWKPDFIWMDIRMPVMDGKEAAKMIKASEHGKATKIVALSAHVLGKERDKIFMAGFDDFVGKPFRENEIFDVMKKHLGLEYVYEEENISGPSVQYQSLETLDLGSLDPLFLEELLIAANNTDAGRIDELADQLESQNPGIAAALRYCSNNFDYESIHSALQGLTKIK